MELEDFDEDDEGIISSDTITPIIKNKRNIDTNTTMKIKKHFRDDSKSQEESFKPKDDTELDNILTEDEKNYVEMSPKKRFGREIVIGTLKRVYRGFDFNEGREVAWNVINVSEMGNLELNSIIYEIKIMKQLHHTNIINYISSWFNKSKKEVVIITEIISGGSLKKHLTKIQNPRLRLIKHWIKEILRGFKYLHEEVNPPIIHRDIKCENIFIDTTNGTVKIGGVGLWRVLHSTNGNSYKGAEEYMAPEVIEGKYTVLADIYSLGMCILEIVSLEKPCKEFENNILKTNYEKEQKWTMPGILEKIQNKNLHNFIISCLKPESERPSANELLSDQFLNENESEENNKPIDLIDVETINKNKENTINFLSEQEKNSEINFCEEFNYDKTAKDFEGNDYFNSNIGIYNENENKYKSELKERHSSNNIPIKSLYKYVNNTRSHDHLDLLNWERSSTANFVDYSNKKTGHTQSRFDSKLNEIKSNDFTKQIYKISNFNKKEEDLRTNKITSIDSKNRIKSHNQIFSKTNLHIDNNHFNKVSLKSSFNKNNTYSKFEINITENKEENLKSTLSKSENESFKNEKREIQINFLVHKEEWVNKKQIITFNYDLFNDTIEGVVQELQKAIGLTEEEFNVVLKKLTDFLNGYKTSDQNSLKNCLESEPVSFAVNLEFQKKMKKDVENFSISFNKLMRKIQNLIQNENTLKLEEFKNKYLNSFNTFKDPEISKIVEEFMKKLEHLKKILKLNEDIIKVN